MKCPVFRIRSARILLAIIASAVVTIVAGCGQSAVTLTPAPISPLYRGTPWKSLALGYRTGDIVSAVKGAGNNVWFADSSGNVVDQTETILGTITTAGATTLYYPNDITGALPIDLQTGPKDTTYFLNDFGGYGIANASGVLTQHETECLHENCGLHAPASPEMAVTADGAAWFGGYDIPPLPSTAYLIRAGDSTDTALPLPSALIGRTPYDFTIGPDGNPWFTSDTSAVIGKVDRTTDEISTFVIPATLNPDRGYAQDIVNGPDGNLWVFLCGKTQGKLLRITLTGAMTAFDLPSALFAACVETSHGLIAGTGQSIWSVTGGASVMRVSTTTGQPATYNIYPAPSDAGGVRTIALGADNNVWAFLATSSYAYVLLPQYEIATRPSSVNLKVKQSATVTVSESEYDGAFGGGSEACATATRFGSTNSFAVTGKTPGSCFVHFSDTVGFATAYVHVVVSN